MDGFEADSHCSLKWRYLHVEMMGGPCHFICFHSLIMTLPSQRKSNKAKEKKARRLEERAAMDAICAKVDAANKVTSSSSQARRRSFIFGRKINPVSQRQRSDDRAIEGAA